MFDADEAHHAWVMAQFERLRPPLITCEAVLSEVAFLLERAGASTSRVPDLVARGLISVARVFDEEAPAIARLMGRYSNVPMSLADACLVRLVERIAGGTLFTLDSDFRIYRQRHRRLIPLLAPSGSAVTRTSRRSRIP